MPFQAFDHTKRLWQTFECFSFHCMHLLWGKSSVMFWAIQWSGYCGKGKTSVANTIEKLESSRIQVTELGSRPSHIQSLWCCESDGHLDYNLRREPNHRPSSKPHIFLKHRIHEIILQLILLFFFITGAQTPLLGKNSNTELHPHLLLFLNTQF